jgi:hypothetical protein
MPTGMYKNKRRPVSLNERECRIPMILRYNETESNSTIYIEK